MTDFTTLSEQLATERVTALPVDLVHADPDQPRRTFPKASLNDLAQDIAQNGVLQPITVRLADDRFVIVMGERRWRAARKAGLESVPALLAAPTILDDDDLTRAFRQLAENHHREALNPMDLSAFLGEIKDRHGLSATEIAAHLKERGFRHLGRSVVANTIRLRELPDRYQAQIRTGEITPTHGRYLVQIAALGDEALDAVDEQLSVELPEDVQPSVSELRSAVMQAVKDTQICLNTFSHRTYQVCRENDLGFHSSALFDPETCQGCPSLKRVTVDGEAILFCTNADGFLEKQRAAHETSERRTAGEESAAGTQDRPGLSDEERRRCVDARISAHLDDLVRDLVVSAMEGETCERFLLWAAAGRHALSEATYSPHGCAILDDAAPYQGDIDDTFAVLLDPTRAVGVSLGPGWLRQCEQIAQRIAREISTFYVWRWALALTLDTDGWTMSRGYLECLDKADLIALAREHQLDRDDNSKKSGLIVDLLALHLPASDRLTDQFVSRMDQHKDDVKAAEAGLAKPERVN